MKKLLFLLAAVAACHHHDPSAPIEAPSRPPEPGQVNLGAPCDAGLEVCGTRGRVAVEKDPWSATFRRSPTCRLGEKRRSVSHAIAWCIEDGRLYARGACFACRVRGAGFSVVALLDELRPSSASSLQYEMGLPIEPVLRGAGAWEDALSRPSAVLDQP